MRPFSLNLRILMWFIVTSIILAGIGGVTYGSFRQVQAQKEWIDHTYKVIENLQNVLSELKDVQSSQRGFVITNQEDYLTPYYIALPTIENDLNTLQIMLNDNPKQERRLKQLREETGRRLAIADDVIQTFRTKGQEKAFAIIRAGAGKREMDQIRIIVAEMVSEENRLLDMRQKNVADSFTLVLRIGAVGIGLCYLILMAIFLLINRESMVRAETEKSLQTALAKVQRISHENALLSRMGDYLQSCQNLDEAHRVIGDNVRTILPETSGRVLLFNNSRNLLVEMLYWGEHNTLIKEFIPECCWGLRRGHAHMSQPDQPGSTCSHILELVDDRVLCIPMQAHGEIIGLFEVRGADDEAFSSHKQNLMQQVSEQISLAISNLKLQERLREQSIRDPLTRLFNRRYLEATLDREIGRAMRENQPLSVIVLDIDHFKKFNDTKGHDAGDALLVQFAQLLQQKTYKDDIACRYGGEEFVIVMPGTDKATAQKRAQIICNATREMKAVHGKDALGIVTVSVGVATYPDQAQNPAQLISLADTALYAAKAGGRNQVVVAP